MKTRNGRYQDMCHALGTRQLPSKYLFLFNISRSSVDLTECYQGGDSSLVFIILESVKDGLSISTKYDSKRLNDLILFSNSPPDKRNLFLFLTMHY